MLAMKIILIYISFLCYTANVYAQTYYYNTAKTFYESGYTYQCDMEPGNSLYLYNKENKFTYADMIDRYTNKKISFRDHKSSLENDNWTRSKCRSIINAAFSSAEKQRIKDEPILIYIYIHPDTGKVIEVKFWFTRNDPYATIPVSVYRKIETELKEKVWFVPTTEGKKYNYIRRAWMHRIE